MCLLLNCIVWFRVQLDMCNSGSKVCHLVDITFLTTWECSIDDAYSSRAEDPSDMILSILLLLFTITPLQSKRIISDTECYCKTLNMISYSSLLSPWFHFWCFSFKFSSWITRHHKRISAGFECLYSCFSSTANSISSLFIRENLNWLMLQLLFQGPNR